MPKKILSYTIDLDFEMLGLVSIEKDYRLSWLLNKALNIELVRVEDLEFSPKKDLQQFHTLFTYKEKLSDQSYFVLKNRGQNGYFIPEQSQVDYFLIIKQSFGNLSLNDLSKLCKKIPEVMAVFTIDVNSLKNKERFTLLEFEE